MTSCQAFYCTNEKGNCEKNFFCNYRSGLSLSTHRPVKTKNTGKYDSIGDKKTTTCVRIKQDKSDSYLIYGQYVKHTWKLELYVDNPPQNTNKLIYFMKM